MGAFLVVFGGDVGRFGVPLEFRPQLVAVEFLDSLVVEAVLEIGVIPLAGLASATRWATSDRGRSADCSPSSASVSLWSRSTRSSSATTASSLACASWSWSAGALASSSALS